MAPRTPHLALYGSIRIPRGRCSICKDMALFLDGISACCGAPLSAEPNRTKRISSPENKRARPPLKDRERLLDLFDHSCVYCHQAFGTWVRTKKRGIRKLRLCWDHQVPWAYSQNNRAENFLPACQICNGWKSSLIFRDVEEVELYVAEKWREATETV